MKLIKKTTKKSDASTSYRKCDRWAQDLYNDSLHSIALPNYIIGNCKGMNSYETEDVLESLKDAKTQFEKVLINLNKAIKALEAAG